MRHRLELATSQLTAVERCDWFRDPLAVLGRHEQRLDEAAARLALGWTRHLAAIRRRLHEIEVTLAAISPQAFLNRQLTRLTRAEHHLRLAMGDRLHQAERAAERRGYDLHMTRLDTRVTVAGERLDRCEQDLDRASAQQLAHARQSLDALHARLEATSHRQTLARGFSITRSRGDRRIVTRPDQAAPGTEITTETADGTFASRVIKSDEESSED